MRQHCLRPREGQTMSVFLISKRIGHPQQRHSSHSRANRIARRALPCILRIHIPCLIHGCQINLIREILQPRGHKRVRTWAQWVDNNYRLPLLREHQQLTPVRDPNGLVTVYMHWLLVVGKSNNTILTFIIRLVRKSFGCVNFANTKLFSENLLEH